MQRRRNVSTATVACVAALVALSVGPGSASTLAASAPVTIRASASVVPWGTSVAFFGSAAGSRVGDPVQIEARSCGGTWSIAVTTPADGGGPWHTSLGIVETTTYRARWRSATSGEVRVATRPSITVREVRRNLFSVGVIATRYFGGRTALLERFDRARSGWRLVRTFRLRDGGATAGTTVGSGARVRASLPRNALVRVVLPRAQAAPCYLAGYSNLLQTSR